MCSQRSVHAATLTAGVLIAAALAASGNQATASIRGTAVDAAATPVSDAVVVVFPADRAAWTGAGRDARVRRVAIVDGRFVIAGLPPGDYRVTFTRAAELDGWPEAATIERLLTRAPVPISLAADDTAGLDVTLTVTPTSIALVHAALTHSQTEVRRAGSNQPLPPGLPGGRGRTSGPPPSTAPGAISGRVTDAEGRPVAGVEVAAVRRVTMSGVPQFARFGQPTVTDEDGRYRLANRAAGQYMVVVTTHRVETRPALESVRQAPAPTTGPDGIRRGFVLTFHGASGAGSPAPVIVQTTEIAGIDVVLERRPVFDVSGRVGVAATGPGPRSVTLAPVLEGLPSTLDQRFVPLAFDGTFTAMDLPEGEYQLTFNADAGWFDERLRVGPGPPAALTLTLRPPIQVRGRAEFVGSAPIPPLGPLQRGTPLNTGVFAELAPARLGPGASMSRWPIAADASFGVTGSGPGPFRLRGIAPAPWVQVAGYVNGIDTLDLALPGDAVPDNAVLVFADREASLLVQVHDADGAPVIGAGVLLAAEDERYWDARSRRLQVGETTPGGTWTAARVPPGRYLIVSGRDISATSEVSAALIGRLKSRALPLEVEVGVSRTVRLRVSGS
jgi:hypothetical protein